MHAKSSVCMFAVTAVCVLLLSSVSAENAVPEGKLLFVIELYRHGARGPLQKWYDAP